MLRKIILALLLSAGLFSVAEAAVQNLSADQAAQLLKGRSDIFLLDVRTPGEYLQTRLAGARLIPIDQLQRRIAEVPKGPVLVYCAVGSRSSAVADYLLRLGYPEVYNLYGGIWAWQLRGLPVLKGPGG
ncbi:MAG: rhodanese-like domain-containing protein [Desulfuromonas sp.]|nr:MAG: rhodanese-like domain-containing protein [Desulfuromonas sp.]